MNERKVLVQRFITHQTGRICSFVWNETLGRACITNKIFLLNHLENNYN